MKGKIVLIVIVDDEGLSIFNAISFCAVTVELRAHFFLPLMLTSRTSRI